jgi:hypothetical protein
MKPITLPRTLLLLAALALAACSGGAKTVENPPPSEVVVAASYAGPAATTSDIQAFQVNFWQNVNASNRCGGCHKESGQMPQFARSDDVNQAYGAALTVVNLVQPDQSRVVQKVAGGHNCWLSSSQACADILTTWIRNWAGGAAGGGSTQIALQAPVDQAVGSSKTFPSDPTRQRGQSAVAVLCQQRCDRGLRSGQGQDQPRHAGTVALLRTS